MAGVLDHRHLHAQADTEEGHAGLPRVADGLDLPLGSAIAEPAGDQHRVVAPEDLGEVVFLEALAVDVGQLDVGLVGDAPVDQRFVERFVAVAEVDVLADHRDGDGVEVLAGGHLGDLPPGAEIRLAGPDVQPLGDVGVEALVVEDQGELVDHPDVGCRDDRVDRHVAEVGDLLAKRLRQLGLRPADQHLRLNAEAEQLLDGVLGGLGLHLAGGLDVRHQRDVDVHRVLRTELGPHLADRLQEGQRLDVTDRAADLDDGHVGLPGRLAHSGADLVGDVGDDLDGRPEVLATPLLGDDGVVDPAGGEVVGPAHRGRGEALVVAEVEVGLGAVVGHEDLAVLVRRHRARIDVDVRVQLEVDDPEATGLHEGAHRGGCEPLADGADDASGHEDVLGAAGHGPERTCGNSGGEKGVGRASTRRASACRGPAGPRPSRRAEPYGVGGGVSTRAVSPTSPRWCSTAALRARPPGSCRIYFSFTCNGWCNLPQSLKTRGERLDVVRYGRHQLTVESHGSCESVNGSPARTPRPRASSEPHEGGRHRHRRESP